jgi:D-sedoheptulose 7-phosphate isomerase
VPHARPARINELHHVVLNCVCDGVDIQLLGDTTPETENPI